MMKGLFHKFGCQRLLVLALCLWLCLSVVHCGGGSPPIDWNERIGVYTLEQAQQDYGEPQGYQDIGDGTRLYLWYNQGRFKWYNVVGLVFDQQGKLVKVDRNERD